MALYKFRIIIIIIRDVPNIRFGAE